ncbi:MAG: hypothetical protein A2042_02010 [Candidatus Schekmanbacteria bacterium GWA2_38_11]|uniref:Uncharacterized protein n=1 Tax=Candidatus Schekmanbacteria bacterium GWA2_38_11 TaxID=1817876 RepID=A0A1F7RPS1_9BACT|nr:MAG: hypothetical protein A2042_02010 [Candidatus Schekmanbacteria bacterium GWA2_38_11]
MTAVNIIFYPDACLPSGRQSFEKFFLLNKGEIMAKNKRIKCKHCDGEGVISKIEDFAADEWVTGEKESMPVEREECEACNGTGYIEVEKKK